jgi:hypothetical protein
MSRFIQPLEQRTLLTATTTSLAAELAAVNTAGGAVKADLATLQTTTKSDNKAIATALKGAPAAALAAGKKFTADETKLLTKIKLDETALYKSVAASSKGAADGDAIIANPASAALGAKIQADVTSLGLVATNPNTKLGNDSNDAGVDADLAALTAADTSSSALATANATAKTHLDTLIAKLTTDGTTLTNAVDVLKVDLTTLLPGPTTSPSLVGDYKGTIKTKAIAFGLGSKTVDLEIDVVSQTINSLSGTITVAGNSGSGTITVLELTTGKVTFKINNTTLTVTLAGNINVKTTPKGLAPGSVITGAGTVTVKGYTVSGSFIVTKVT